MTTVISLLSAGTLSPDSVDDYFFSIHGERQLIFWMSSALFTAAMVNPSACLDIRPYRTLEILHLESCTVSAAAGRQMNQCGDVTI